jgi:hypothetical protein
MLDEHAQKCTYTPLKISDSHFSAEIVTTAIRDDVFSKTYRLQGRTVWLRVFSCRVKE